MDILLPAAVGLFAAVILVGASAKRLREHERAILLRFGRAVRTVGPGVVLIIPFVDRLVRMTVTDEGAGETGAPLEESAPRVTVTSRSAEETLDLGRRIAPALRRGDLVALVGELGTGKTLLARGIAEGLGASGYIASPTFTLIREYQGRLPMYHVDLFRLHSHEVADLGLEEVMEQGVTVIEWAERAPELLRPPMLWIALSFGQTPEQRDITLSAEGEGPAAALAAIPAVDARTPA